MEYPKFNKAARAEVYNMLESIEKTFDTFGDRDAITASAEPLHKSWLEGRSAGYKLVADHIRRTKVIYEEEA